MQHHPKTIPVEFRKMVLPKPTLTTIGGLFDPAKPSTSSGFGSIDDDTSYELSAQRELEDELSETEYAEAQRPAPNSSSTNEVRARMDKRRAARRGRPLAPPAVTPPRSIERIPDFKGNAKTNLYAMIGLSSILVVILVCWVMTTFFLPTQQFEPTQIVAYHIRKDGCLELTENEIFSLRKDKNWEQAYKSMTHWMTNMTRLQVITAFHVASPYCFVMLRNHDGSLVDLFNLKFVGYSKHKVVSRNEVSLACKDMVKNVDRAQTIVVEYNDPYSGDLMVRSFNTTQSYSLQSAGFYLKGLSTCDDSDMGLKSLEKFIKG